jgi:hypothetical protein
MKFLGLTCKYAFLQNNASSREGEIDGYHFISFIHPDSRKANIGNPNSHQ